MSLFLHAGAQHVTLEEVRAVPTPDSTETWFPVPHSTVIDAIKTGLADHSNFNVVSEESVSYTHLTLPTKRIV